MKNNIIKLIKIAINIFTCILIGVLIIYLILTINQKISRKNELLSFDKYYIFQIASGSMETNLHIGDYIVIEKTNEYKVGDIITYVEDGAYITHRIYKINGDEIITKGDANKALDESISSKEIVGKFMFKARILSFIMNNKYITIVLLVIIYLVEELIKINTKKANNENDIGYKEE